MTAFENCLSAFHNADKPRSLEWLRLCPDPASIKTESKDTNGVLTIWNLSLLHLSAKNNWPDVASILICDYHCNPETENNRLSTPLHYSARYGSLETLKYLIEQHGCNPMRLTKNKWTALHWAASTGQLHVLQYLIEVQHCDPWLKDKNGHNLLHLACSGGHTESVVYLLRTGKVDPSLTDAWGCTPSEWARNTNTDELPVIRLLKYFEDCRLESPVDTYTQVFVLGNKEAGKTSLITVLKERSRGGHGDKDGNIIGVDLHTIGIVPIFIQSFEIGNMIFYDFAGHSEYYYSHGAVLEKTVTTISPIFIVVIDISQNESYIIKQFHYWINFLRNITSNADFKPKVLIIASHMDCIETNELCQQRISIMESLLMKYYSQCIECLPIIAMDCRKVNSNEICNINRNLLLHSLSIIAQSLHINYTCHVLYSFLKNDCKVAQSEPYCTLDQLSYSIKDAHNVSEFIPSDKTVLAKLLTVLSEKGFIIFLKDQNTLGNSWVIFDIHCLLHEIHGTLFSQDHRCVSFVDNIGIVPVNCLAEMFPNHDPIMLAAVLNKFELCHIFNDNEDTERESIEKALLFFPSLVTACRPAYLPSEFQFKWYLQCVDASNFFSVRFSYVLLLKIALTFPLEKIQTMSSSHIYPEVSRRCHMWNFGVYWVNEDFVETVVELNDLQEVIVSMKWKQGKEKEMAKLRSSIISLIVSLHQKLCSSISVVEFLSMPNSSLAMTPPTKFVMQDIARAVVLKKGVVDDQGLQCRSLDELLQGEPFVSVSTDVLVKMFATEHDNKVPPCTLQQLNIDLSPSFIFYQPMTFSSLKCQLECFSLFNGRSVMVNSIVIAYYCLMTYTTDRKDHQRPTSFRHNATFIPCFTR